MKWFALFFAAWSVRLQPSGYLKSAACWKPALVSIKKWNSTTWRGTCGYHVFQSLKRSWRIFSLYYRLSCSSDKSQHPPPISTSHLQSVDNNPLIFLNTSYLLYLVHKFWWREEFSCYVTILCICTDILNHVQMGELKLEVLKGTALRIIYFEV